MPAVLSAAMAASKRSTWQAVRACYRGKKRRRREYLRLCREYAELVTALAPDWSPRVAGVG